MGIITDSLTRTN